MWFQASVAQYLGCPSKRGQCQYQGESSSLERMVGVLLPLHPQGVYFRHTRGPGPIRFNLHLVRCRTQPRAPVQAGKNKFHTHSAQDTQLSVFLPESSGNNLQSRYYCSRPDNLGNKKLPEVPRSFREAKYKGPIAGRLQDQASNPEGKEGSGVQKMWVPIHTMLLNLPHAWSNGAR